MQKTMEVLRMLYITQLTSYHVDFTHNRWHENRPFVAFSSD